MADAISPAMILNMVPYSERDLILTLLTREHGMVSAMARSAMGSRRRYGGALDLFVVFSANLKLKPEGKLSTLIGAEATRQFPGILEDLTRLETGQAMLAVSRDLLRDAPSGPEMFDGIVNALSMLENEAPATAHTALVDLCMHILGQIGHAPDTATCPACRAGFSERPRAFLVAHGAVLCEECAEGHRGMPVSTAVLEAVGKRDSRVLGHMRTESLAFLTSLLSNILGRSYRIRLGDGFSNAVESPPESSG
ncbi:MAG: DNA repair protein RecO [Deltaproteobacteria bacterium]|nr:DNA repair protein RecO [Deltaproteobacteria bacterium]